jgi:hypothetical protein
MTHDHDDYYYMMSWNIRTRIAKLASELEKRNVMPRPADHDQMMPGPGPPR